MPVEVFRHVVKPHLQLVVDHNGWNFRMQHDIVYVQNVRRGSLKRLIHYQLAANDDVGDEWKKEHAASLQDVDYF